MRKIFNQIFLQLIKNEIITSENRMVEFQINSNFYYKNSLLFKCFAFIRII